MVLVVVVVVGAVVVVVGGVAVGLVVVVVVVVMLDVAYHTTVRDATGVACTLVQCVALQCGLTTLHTTRNVCKSNCIEVKKV